MNRTALALALSTGVFGRSHAQPCAPQWSGEFRAEDLDGPVRALLVVEGGTHDGLYAGGTFKHAAGEPAGGVARFDGQNWSVLAGGMASAQPGQSPVVYALARFDDSGRSALYAGGKFSSAGGVLASNIAKWTGQAWEALGAGVNAEVRALAAFDDGSGPALFAAGFFTGAGGVEAIGVARWTGAAWADVGGGLSGANAIAGLGGHCLAVHDDGGGPALYVGGRFTSAGGIAAANIGRWRGGAWSSVGDGLTGAVPTVGVLLSTHESGESVLFAGGWFAGSGATPAPNLARWDGRAWSAFGETSTWSPVSALTVFDTGTGPTLHAAKTFPDGSHAVLLRWEPAGWTWFSHTTGSVRALAVFDDGTGKRMIAAGGLTSIDSPPSVAVRHVAAWNGAAWDAVRRSRGVEGSSAGGSLVSDLRVLDDGTGPALYAGGSFTFVGGVSARGIAKRSRRAWSALGEGLSSYVHSLDVFDDGSGPAIHAGGSLLRSGASPIRGVARWRDGAWTEVGGGLAMPPQAAGTCHAMRTYDDGTGAALYVGGGFTVAGNAPASYIARWNGTSWSEVGGGVHPASPGTSSIGVSAFEVFDDGAGPVLYAGGQFARAGSTPARNIARWNGATWTDVGGGVSGAIGALVVFDDGSGPALVAAGTFDEAGGVAARMIAEWDGRTWRALGNGMTGYSVQSLAVFDDGGGPRLYAAGVFEMAGSVPALRLARWDGTAWTAVPGGGAESTPYAMTPFSDDGAPGLFVGGTFEFAGGVSALRIAKLEACPGCYADCDYDGVLTPADFACFQSKFVAGSPYADCTADGALTVADFGCFQTRFVAGCP